MAVDQSRILSTSKLLALSWQVQISWYIKNMFQIRRRSRSTAQCSACKTTHLEQSQKAQKYVSDAADGYFMLKYVLSPNLVFFFCFKSQVSKKTPCLLYTATKIWQILHSSQESIWQQIHDPKSSGATVPTITTHNFFCKMWWYMDAYKYTQSYLRLTCLLISCNRSSAGASIHSKRSLQLIIEKYKLHHSVGLATEVIWLMEAQISLKKVPNH